MSFSSPNQNLRSGSNPFGSPPQQLPPGQQLQQYYQQKSRTPSLSNQGQLQGQGLLSPLQETGGPDQPDDPSKLSGFFKNISFGNRTTKDGQPAKRRGPKPDSKPAQTRRQELNRQAQRTHRERKEAYLRQLESEVTRLREAFSIITKEKSQLSTENAELKRFLALHGLSWPPDPSTDPTSALAPAPIPPPPPVPLGSMPGIPSSLVSPPALSQLVTSPPSAQNFASPPAQSALATSPNVNGAFDAIGIDFVLALERPCMEHIQKLVHDSLEDPNGTSISGHALMASCPPESHMLDNPDVDWGSRTYDLQPSELNALLNLSPKLSLSGEITPINAWAIIQAHPNFLQLTRHDFAAIKNELVPKVKCYGFGAVLEEYMVEDALDAVFAAKYALANQRIQNSHYSF
ncbi:hypothetical protein TWF696_001887 [Orbilia brochopaga]|uniref:BZIP domain-containing protein n=1 Tax=Orbilia brochopaga TaxID=3140254 RepID=A0AAV9U8E7_9PEZI